MALRNDDGARTVHIGMTPVEALLTLESLSIGHASMYMYDNRGQKERAAISAVEERLVEATGLTPRLAGMLADGMSGIFNVLKAQSRPGVAKVSVLLDEKAQRVLAEIDGRVGLLMSMRERKAGGTNGPRIEDHWERERVERAERVAAFDSLSGELTAFLRDQAPMGVEFSVEAPVACIVPRELLEKRSTAALDTVFDTLLESAFGECGGEARRVRVDSDLYSDNDTIVVRARAVLPVAVLKDTAEMLADAVDRAQAGSPAPGR